MSIMTALIMFMVAFLLCSSSSAAANGNNQQILTSKSDDVEVKALAGCTDFCHHLTTGPCQHPEEYNDVCFEKMNNTAGYLVCPSGLIECGDRPSYPGPVENFDADSIPVASVLVSSSPSGSHFPSPSVSNSRSVSRTASNSRSVSRTASASASPIIVPISINENMVTNWSSGKDSDYGSAKRAFDNNVATQWNTWPVDSAPNWLTFDFGETRVITDIMIRCSGDRTHDVNVWDLHKSNTDDGQNWGVVLQMRARVGASTEQWFHLPHPTALKVGRIYIHSTHSQWQPYVREIGFKGY